MLIQGGMTPQQILAELHESATDRGVAAWLMKDSKSQELYEEISDAFDWARDEIEND